MQISHFIRKIDWIVIECRNNTMSNDAVILFILHHFGFSPYFLLIISTAQSGDLCYSLQRKLNYVII